VLAVTPPQGSPGQTFQLALSGAIPAEIVKFEIDSPSRTFTGSPHTAAEDGSVSATYYTDAGNPTGDYVVKATGDQGTIAQAVFHLVKPDTPRS
jgi:hypothetical protein